MSFHPDPDSSLFLFFVTLMLVLGAEISFAVVHLQRIEFYKVVSLFASSSLCGSYDFAFWNKRTFI